MVTSEHGLEVLQDLEGTKYTGYLDIAGIPTAGVGHTGADVAVGKSYTQAQVSTWLKEDIKEAEDAVNRLVKVALTQNQFDALALFTYNEGEGALAGSTLLHKLNAGDYKGASQEFPKWDKVHIDGKLVDSPGLYKRRLHEQALFLT